MGDDEEKNNICIRDIFEDIITELTPIATGKSVRLFLDCDNSLVFGNTDLLYRAFYNLVENGIKYNTDSGTVKVIVNKLEEKRVSIKIMDTGIGIPDDNKKYIFEPFYRVDKSRSRQFGGVGLGLSIVENAIKKNSGIVTVTNNENGGTCFEIILKSAYS